MCRAKYPAAVHPAVVCTCTRGQCDRHDPARIALYGPGGGAWRGALNTTATPTMMRGVKPTASFAAPDSSSKNWIPRVTSERAALVALGTSASRDSRLRVLDTRRKPELATDFMPRYKSVPGKRKSCRRSPVP